MWAISTKVGASSSVLTKSTSAQAPSAASFHGVSQQPARAAAMSAVGRAGDGRLQRQAELAGQRRGVLLLDRDALGGEVLAAAEPEDERPRGQLVGVDVRAAGREQPRQVGVVDDEDFVAEPDPVEPVGEVDQLVELVGGGEQVLVGGGDAART